MSEPSAFNHDIHERSHGSIASYTIGFLLAVILTMVAYVLTVRHVLAGNILVATLLGLAIIQLIVQLFFFLHIGRETKPRWRAVMLLMAIGVVVILVIGSIWIMYNLNYRMTPQQIQNYLRKEGGSDL